MVALVGGGQALTERLADLLEGMALKAGGVAVDERRGGLFGFACDFPGRVRVVMGEGGWLCGMCGAQAAGERCVLGHPRSAAVAPVAAAGATAGSGVVEATSGQRTVAPSTCPACGLVDAVQRVSVVIDEGTTRTSGQTHSRGVSVGTQGVAVSRSKGTINATSVSDLVGRRFRLPTRPGTGHSTAIWVVIFLVGVALTMNVPESMTGVTFYGGVVVATVAAFAYARQPGLRTRIARWDRAKGRFSKAYYCRRDDVMFDAGGPAAAEPEAFIKAIFSC